MKTTIEFAQFQGAGPRTSVKITTFKQLVDATPGTKRKLLDSGRSVLVTRPDGTTVLLILSKPLQAELASGAITPEQLGGCEIHSTEWVDAATGEKREAYRLQRPEGATGTIIGDLVDYVPAKRKVAAPTGITTEALLAALSGNPAPVAAGA